MEIYIKGENIMKTKIVRWQVKIFGGEYICKNKTPLKFITQLNVEKWISNNQHNYEKRLCSVPIVKYN